MKAHSSAALRVLSVIAFSQTCLAFYGVGSVPFSLSPSSNWPARKLQADQVNRRVSWTPNTWNPMGKRLSGEMDGNPVGAFGNMERDDKASLCDILELMILNMNKEDVPEVEKLITIDLHAVFNGVVCSTNVQEITLQEPRQSKPQSSASFVGTGCRCDLSNRRPVSASASRMLSNIDPIVSVPEFGLDSARPLVIRFKLPESLS